MKEFGTHGLSPEDVADEMLHALGTGDAEKFARLYGYDAVTVSDIFDMLGGADDDFVARLRGLGSDDPRLDGLVDMFFHKRMEEAAEGGDVQAFIDLFEKSGFDSEDLEDVLEGSDAELPFMNRLRPFFPEGELDERLSDLAELLLEDLAASGDAKSFMEAFDEYPVFLERRGPEEVASLLEDANSFFLQALRGHPLLGELLEDFEEDRAEPAGE